MIINDLVDSYRVNALHPMFKMLFEYVKTHDLYHTELGRIEIDGDKLFINNVNPECVPCEKQVLEGHRKYIDIHILLEGSEIIGWKSINEAINEIKPYEKEGDCVLYSDTPSTFIKLQPGQFAIIYPEDLHAPLIGEGKIRKLVAKVLL